MKRKNKIKLQIKIQFYSYEWEIVLETTNNLFKNCFSTEKNIVLPFR